MTLLEPALLVLVIAVLVFFTWLVDRAAVLILARLAQVSNLLDALPSKIKIEPIVVPVLQPTPMAIPEAPSPGHSAHCGHTTLTPTVGPDGLTQCEGCARKPAVVPTQDWRSIA